MLVAFIWYDSHAVVYGVMVTHTLCCLIELMSIILGVSLKLQYFKYGSADVPIEHWQDLLTLLYVQLMVAK